MAAGPVQAHVREVARQGQAISGVRFFRRFLCAFKEIGSGASLIQIGDPYLESRTKQATMACKHRGFTHENSKSAHADSCLKHDIFNKMQKFSRRYLDGLQAQVAEESASINPNAR